MPFMYTADGRKVELTLSPDDVGIRMDNPAASAMAVRSARLALAGPPGLHEWSPRSYGRTVLVHQPGASRTAFATVRDLLSRQEVSSVRRTLPVYIEGTSGLRVIASREVTVRFKSGVTDDQQNGLLAGMGLTKERANEFEPLRQFVVVPQASVDEEAAMELANRLREADDLVEYAATNFISEHRKTAATNDPFLASQWHLANTGQNGGLATEDVQAFQAWDITPGGSPDIVIAIVDDGVDIGHPDLKANIWANPIPSAPDRNGRNFYDDNFDPIPRYFHPPYDQMEGNDIHGTPCAGVAAAVGNNRIGVAGIAYRCKILPVKIFGADALAPNDRVADAIRYAGMHAQVISCSWSGPWNTDLESAITDVTEGGRGGKGCLVFCATGNDGLSRIGFPASHVRAFGVGASNDVGQRAGYSNYGDGLQFVAPSSDPWNHRQGITTTDIRKRNRGFSLNSAYTDAFGGTSSATPLAAGIGALVLSVNPALTATEVRDILRETADKIDAAGGSYNVGYSQQYGYGRLNAFEAVKRARR